MNSSFCWLLIWPVLYTVWLLWIFEVRFQYWSGSRQTGYTGVWSGFWATRWEKLIGVWIQDLNITCSAFQRLLLHTFPMPTAMFMTISVQPHVELAVCWKIGLSNGMELSARLGTTLRLWLFKLVIKIGWLGDLMQCNLTKSSSPKQKKWSAIVTHSDMLVKCSQHRC
jgi:hypothetical protein